MLTTSNLAIKTTYCRYIEPPAGGDTVNINSKIVVFGATTWLRATSTLVSFYAHSYFFQGIQVNSGLSVGAGNLLVAKLSIDQYGNLTTAGTIACTGNLAAPNIYTKT